MIGPVIVPVPEVSPSRPTETGPCLTSRGSRAAETRAAQELAAGGPVARRHGEGGRRLFPVRRRDTGLGGAAGRQWMRHMGVMKDTQLDKLETLEAREARIARSGVRTRGHGESRHPPLRLAALNGGGVAASLAHPRLPHRDGLSAPMAMPAGAAVTARACLRPSRRCLAARVATRPRPDAAHSQVCRLSRPALRMRLSVARPGFWAWGWQGRRALRDHQPLLHPPAPPQGRPTRAGPRPVRCRSRNAARAGTGLESVCGARAGKGRQRIAIPAMPNAEPAQQGWRMAPLPRTGPRLAGVFRTPPAGLCPIACC